MNIYCSIFQFIFFFRISFVGSLRLYNISLEDSGLYSCVATNSLGEAFADGSLTVEGWHISCYITLPVVL